jgi:hypothetical protein
LNSNLEIFENSRKRCKKLDGILRSLVKTFFKSQPFDTFKFKFHQICTDWHQILFFPKFTKYKKQT